LRRWHRANPSVAIQNCAAVPYQENLSSAHSSQSSSN
jgi:hypothetical protein